MTEIEKKALELVNEVRRESGKVPFALYDGWRTYACGNEALCRVIEQHEAFRQEVSAEMLEYSKWCKSVGLQFPLLLERFIIAKPDPLVEAMQEWWDADGYADIETFRAAIEKRGGKIVWGEKQ